MPALCPVRGEHRVDDRVQVGDDGALTAVLDEAADGIDLGAHRAAGEVALGGVRPQLRDADPAESLRLGCAKPEDRVGYVGRDDEHVDPDGAGQHRRPEILVDHGLDPAE